MSRSRLEKATRQKILAGRRLRAQRRETQRLLGQEAARLFAARTITGKAKT